MYMFPISTFNSNGPLNIKTQCNLINPLHLNYPFYEFVSSVPERFGRHVAVLAGEQWRILPHIPATLYNVHVHFFVQ
jgi:hypothetical protein